MPSPGSRIGYRNHRKIHCPPRRRFGQECLDIVTYVPDWRWLLDCDDSPSYPMMKPRRQPALNDWSSAIADVVNLIALI